VRGVEIQSIELLYANLYIVDASWVVDRIVWEVLEYSIELLYANLYIVDPSWVEGRIGWEVLEYSLLNYCMLTSI
jgi:hypothetical protein